MNSGLLYFSLKEINVGGGVPRVTAAMFQLFARARFGSKYSAFSNFTRNRRTFFVATKETPNPESLQFFPENLRVLPEGTPTVTFSDALESRTSPLARVLFQQPGVKRVFLGPDFVTVTKSDEIEWDQLETIVSGTLLEFYASGEPALLSQEELPQDTEILDDDSEDVALIKELIETRIRPGLQSDGGDIVYHGFVNNIIFVELKGSCDGCPSSTNTLKNGIERTLKHWVEQVECVTAVKSKDEFLKLTESSGEAEMVKE